MIRPLTFDPGLHHVAAQAVESGAGKVADKLETNQAEAAREGRPGAVDPATDTRVPAKY